MEHKSKKIYLSPPHMSGLEKQFINEAFESNWIAPLGEQVDAFECELSEYVRSNGALALSSGTAALHLALRLLDIKPGDIVFCSSLTFIASANPILYQGATPIFIDSEIDTWNMSPTGLERAFHNAEKSGKLPKAVILATLYGQCADIDAIMKLCNYYDVPLIEDAAESLGATYRGKASGTFGVFGIYSFNGNKIMTTSGGGMLVSDDLDMLEKARFLATQARDHAPYYQHSEMGYNYRLSNVLAGIGRGQLKVLDKRIEKRRQIFNCYKESFHDVEGFTFMNEPSLMKSTRWLTTMTVDKNKCGVSAAHMISKLNDKNIEARHVWKPMHLQPLFKTNSYYSHNANNSVSDQLFENGICLPSGSSLSEEDQSYIIESIREIL